ncbi:hypothetical protein [Bradyrhizobium sp. CCBAU 53338]|uniref:hypothetical protein n=1 Tax=Bradyrhizobium sp. CCBAU 53338 TaxID=1325111 RepID=UPI001FEF1B39|nr:hypothetical protein [Bradyrhizobium sp. CCBAU 53338]
MPIDDAEQSLEDWLGDLKVKKPNVIDFSFPTDELRDEYVGEIAERPDEEVIDLIRRFLIPSGSLGADQSTFSWLAHLASKGELRRLTEFQRRLILYAKAMLLGALAQKQIPPPWEGVTWVLDLLPDNPRAAINTLNAYFEAHCGFMPDGRMHGIADATELIRAKYIISGLIAKYLGLGSLPS